MGAWTSTPWSAERRRSTRTASPRRSARCWPARSCEPSCAWRRGRHHRPRGYRERLRETVGARMNVGVLGTGIVGRTLAWGLSEIGHDAMIGTRDPAALGARTDRDAMGNQPFPDWHADHSSVRVGTFAEAAAHGAMIFNATSGGGSLDALRLAGADNLDGKVLVDVSN